MKINKLQNQSDRILSQWKFMLKKRLKPKQVPVSMQCNDHKQGMPFVTCKSEPDDTVAKEQHTTNSTVKTEDDEDAIPFLGDYDKAVIPGPSLNVMDVCFVKEETVINPGMQLQCHGQKRGVPVITCQIEPEDDPVTEDQVTTNSTVKTENDEDAIPLLGKDDKAVTPGPSQNILDECFVKEETVIHPGNLSGHSDVCTPVEKEKNNDVYITPDTIIPDSDSHSDGLLVERKKSSKSGRAIKGKVGRPKTSDKSRAEQQREARKRYKQAHPEVVRNAQKRYAAKHPEVNRAAAKRYAAKHPDVNRAAVKRYTEKHPEVNRAAVKRYTEKHPEVHRAAVKRYTAKHPEVNRAAVKRYTEKHPEVHRAAAKRYAAKNPEVHRAAAKRYADKVKSQKLLFNEYGVQDMQECIWMDVPEELEITHEPNDPLQCLQQNI